MKIALTRQFILLRLLMLAMLMLRESLSRRAFPAVMRRSVWASTVAVWVVCNLLLSQVSAGVFPMGRNTPGAQQVKNIRRIA